jgi:hypothetical protein
MKKSTLGVFLLVSISLLVPRIAAAAEDVDQKPDLLVDDDKVQCPAATFTSIQEAIKAANPGNLIRVCPGTYRDSFPSTNHSASKATMAQL